MSELQEIQKLKRLKELFDEGFLTEEEFKDRKAELLLSAKAKLGSAGIQQNVKHTAQAVSVGEAEFRGKVDRALDAARRVLENERQPVLASEVPHKWDDKFGLAESLTNLAVGAEFNVLEALGLNAKSLKLAKEWSEKRSVTLRFKAEEHCSFLREEKKEVENPTKHVTDYGVGKIVDKVVTTVTTYYWKFEHAYSLSIYAGTDVDDGVILQSRKAACEITTMAKQAPRKETVVRDAISVDITWPLQQLQQGSLELNFRIDRGHEDCHTPRRNVQTQQALDFFGRFDEFAFFVTESFRSDIFHIPQDHRLDLGTINDKSVFVPVVPLFEAYSERLRQLEEAASKQTGGLVPVKNGAEPGKPVMTASVLARLLQEERRSLGEKLAEMAKAMPEGPNKIISCVEANLLIALDHSVNVGEYFAGGSEFIEDMIRKALVAAIGKEVTALDFGNYMQFHNRKLFLPAYQPKAFCYAIRRPDHYPEGILSIEAQLSDGSMPEPIQTIVSRADLTSPMQFEIAAGTKVKFEGEVYLHGAVMHEFEGQSGVKLNLSARARQFSSFLVLVGRVTGPGLFDPQYGIIVQNKDEVTIPLDLETIPSAGEFKAATVSISPEQQAFAKMYRSMQLASTLFGVCVIQIKPQVERVLNLTNESLTKEIRLTQDLLKLFIEYQIPSDLLSFQGANNASKEVRLQAVKNNVRLMHWTVDAEKHKQIEEQFLEYEKKMLERISKVGATILNDIIHCLHHSGGTDNIKSAGKLGSVRFDSADYSMARTGAKKGVAAKKDIAATIKKRDEDIREIEKNLDEVKDVFQDLNSLVAEQGAELVTAQGAELEDQDKQLDDLLSDISSLKSMSKNINSESATLGDLELLLDESEGKRSDARRNSGDFQSTSKKSFFSLRKKPQDSLKEMTMEKKNRQMDFKERNEEEIRRLRAELEARREVVQRQRDELKRRKEEIDNERAQLPTGNSEERERREQEVSYAGRDYGQVPGLLDSKLEVLDAEGALRPTIIKVAKVWNKSSCKTLLSDAVPTHVTVDQQKLCKNACFDLLDALTQSGGLKVENAALHVLVASTHLFDRSVMNTLVQDNVNPIEKMERSLVIVASAIHDKPPQELLHPMEAKRIQTLFPLVFSSLTK